ncbi:MAG: tRNA uridine-5-carboxymethylaminomethyl(34) synthesis GTPase MnmE, partial [Prevotella sp.]|nr:tRNA uridine-5-carboxymethylaminomethyl(34) synthesis GTPase MnmE [Prevotella sp.]
MNRLINDTIVALATPAGGAIGVVRLSGPDAIGITAGLFRSVNPNFDLNDAKAGTVHYGRLVDIQGEEVDDVVVSLYRAPHSYTGEDSSEISCHGSA